jgi:two-component system chemotaxis response regulator CheB
MSNSLNVLVVDDSAVVRQTVRALLETQPDIHTTVAHDPLIAMDKMKRERPDVIILDLELPRMGGLEFLRRIMRDDPLPVIVCSGHVGEASAQALLALEAGAVELIAKPKLGVQAFLEESAVLLIDAVRAAASCKLVLRRGRGPNVTADVLVRAASPLPFRAGVPSVIAIGASTGGTEAIRDVLDAMPATSCGIVIVQHMPAPFTASFAKRLDERCAIEVREASPGDEVRPGCALIAPGDRHLVVVSHGRTLHVDVIDGPLVSRHRPSVDVLFRSVAVSAGASSVGVILTGMGADGAAGLLDLRKADAYTIAQDEPSSAVFGMPKEAIKRGAARSVLPLSEIGPALARLSVVDR